MDSAYEGSHLPLNSGAKTGSRDPPPPQKGVGCAQTWSQEIQSICLPKDSAACIIRIKQAMIGTHLAKLTQLFMRDLATVL